MSRSKSTPGRCGRMPPNNPSRKQQPAEHHIAFEPIPLHLNIATNIGIEESATHRKHTVAKLLTSLMGSAGKPAVIAAGKVMNKASIAPASNTAILDRFERSCRGLTSGIQGKWHT